MVIELKFRKECATVTGVLSTFCSCINSHVQMTNSDEQNDEVSRYGLLDAEQTLKSAVRGESATYLGTY